jgi:hypothetical protein
MFRSSCFLLEQKAALTERRKEIVALADSDLLDDLDGTLESVSAAATAIALAQLAREQAREKFARWKQILPKCRQATEEFEAICREVERAGFKLAEVRDRADRAFDKVMQTRDKRPKSEQFPTDHEIEEQNRREAKAEANHREHVARLKEANEAHEIALRNQWQTKLALDKLLFDERQLRPRQQAEPEPLLSAVR